MFYSRFDRKTDDINDRLDRLEASRQPTLSTTSDRYHGAGDSIDNINARLDRLHTQGIAPARSAAPAPVRPSRAAPSAPANTSAPQEKEISYSAEDGNVVIAVVSQLFKGADVNQDGRLDAEELSQLLKQHSLSADTKINLVGEVRDSMARMGCEAGGSITMQQFLRLLSQPAWRFILPTDLQTRLPFVLLRDSFPTNPADAVYQSAYQMFDAADTDRSGFLDVPELCVLLQQLFRDGVETNLDPAVKMRIGSHVEASVKQLGKRFDTGLRLGFLEFCRLIALKPWRDSLPADVAAGLPQVIRRAASPQRMRGAE
jgi:hypothetical protein